LIYRIEPEIPITDWHF